jgi:hypothetical protein
MNLHHTAIPPGVIADGVDWYPCAPAPPVKRTKSGHVVGPGKLRKRAARKQKFKAEHAEHTANINYAQVLLARELALTAAATRGGNREV